MSERHTHEAAAVINYRTAEALRVGGGAPLHWLPTVLFYVVVNMVYARLADDNEHPTTQADIENAARRFSADVSGSQGYGKLKRLSEDWRYRGLAPRPDQLTVAWRWAENVTTAIREPWPPR